MKKILLTLILSIFLIPNVNAEEIPINVRNHTFEEFYEKTVDYNGETIRLYDYFMNIFNSQTEYKYYVLEFYSYGDNYFYNTHFYMFDDFSYTIHAATTAIGFSSDSFNVLKGYNGDFYSADSNSGGGPMQFTIGYNTYRLLDTNANFILNGANYAITGLYDTTIYLNSGDRIPSLKDLSNEDTRNNYINGEGNYTEVNLDNYKYVILNLKNYNSTDAFNTNLKVKGMIGITPIYEFGTVEKEVITDRCNLSYSDYTNYRFSILKNDLINNSVYYVKGCEDGSSFKFDSSIFDITYVTADNVDDPVITVGEQNYHTIPFNKLSNSANKNEENNFIPGESTNGTITTITDTITSYISNFWNGLVTFMGLVTKFFNTLPIEIRSISIVAFSVGLTLGIIKFIKS